MKISRARLDHSVLKMLKIKGALGLNDLRTVDLSAIATTVGKPENIAFGQQVADSATTLVRDNGKVLPLKELGQAQDLMETSTIAGKIAIVPPPA